MEKIILKIKKSSFVDWYFNTGSDQEQELCLNELGRQALEEMVEGNDATITIEAIWDACEKTMIQMMFFEGFEKKEHTSVNETYPDGAFDVEFVLIEG